MSYRVQLMEAATGRLVWVDVDGLTLPVTNVQGRNILSAQPAGGTSPIPPQPPIVGPQWSMGYWNSVVITSPFQPPSTIDWGGLTHLIHQVATVNADGTLTPNLTSQGIAADVAQLKAAAGSVKIILGLAQGDYSSAVTHRPAFVNNIMALVNQYGYDGVDLDWEPNPNVAQLGQDLRSALGQKLLTAAAIVTGYNYWGTVVGSFDRVNIMTYDMYETTPAVWFNSALKGPADNSVWSVDLAVTRYLAGGVPASKLGIGLPFYGQNWPSITSPKQSAPNPSQMHYTDIQPLIGTREYSYDFVAKVPTLSTPGLIGYDNEQSLTEKIQYAKQHALGGWIIWNLNLSFFPTAAVKNPLLAAVKAAR